MGRTPRRTLEDRIHAPADARVAEICRDRRSILAYESPGGYLSSSGRSRGRAAAGPEPGPPPHPYDPQVVGVRWFVSGSPCGRGTDRPAEPGTRALATGTAGGGHGAVERADQVDARAGTKPGLRGCGQSQRDDRLISRAQEPEPRSTDRRQRPPGRRSDSQRMMRVGVFTGDQPAPRRRGHRQVRSMAARRRWPRASGSVNAAPARRGRLGGETVGDRKGPADLDDQDGDERLRRRVEGDVLGVVDGGRQPVASRRWQAGRRRRRAHRPSRWPARWRRRRRVARRRQASIAGGSAPGLEPARSRTAVSATGGRAAER